MAILTLSQFQRSFDTNSIRELADDHQVGPDMDIVQDQIDIASAWMKSQLSRLYSTVELEADAAVRDAVAVETMYRLQRRRKEISPAIQQAHEEVLKWLEALQAGAAKLGGVAQLLPRISPGTISRVFRESGFFDGYEDAFEDTT